MLFASVSRFRLALPVILYYTYLLLDIWVLPQGRITKIARDLATPLLMLVWYPVLSGGIGMPQIESLSLAAAIAGLLIPYYWTNYYDAQRFMRGLVLTYYIGLTLEIFEKTRTPLGLHWALIGYVLFYTLYHRTLYWYFQAGFVLLYGITLIGIFGAPSTTYWIVYLLLGAIINLYMLVFKFTAHDGRVI
jgi:hypothetical protein